MFPLSAKQITLIGNDNKEERKTFTPYTSSSRECRIGGLKHFFEMYALKDGDEIVIIKIDDDKYKILPESVFQKKIMEAFYQFEKSGSETESDAAIKNIETISNENKKIILQNEFVRLSNVEAMPERNVKGGVPLFLRRILSAMYNGKCQITNFTFLKNNGEPYFEVHHINPDKGDHPKNLLVVCPNLHRQFHTTSVLAHYDEHNWLRRIKFNDDYYAVFQIIDVLPKAFEKEVHF
jgi:hypothetical protein